MVRFRPNVPVMQWAAGEVVTVERSRQIDGLIANGYVTVLDEQVPDFPADEVADLSPDVAGAHGKLTVAAVVVPARTGKTAPQWREFLAGQGIPADEGLTRDELIALWDNRQV